MSFKYEKIGPCRHRFSYEHEGNIILPKTKQECPCNKLKEKKEQVRTLESQNEELVEELKNPIKLAKDYLVERKEYLLASYLRDFEKNKTFKKSLTHAEVIIELTEEEKKELFKPEEPVKFAEGKEEG